MKIPKDDLENVPTHDINTIEKEVKDEDERKLNMSIATSPEMPVNHNAQIDSSITNNTVQKCL